MMHNFLKAAFRHINPRQYILGWMRTPKLVFDIELIKINKESMAGSIFQDTGMIKFVDVLRTGVLVGGF